MSAILFLARTLDYSIHMHVLRPHLSILPTAGNVLPVHAHNNVGKDYMLDATAALISLIPMQCVCNSHYCSLSILYFNHKRVSYGLRELSRKKTFKNFSVESHL